MCSASVEPEPLDDLEAGQRLPAVEDFGRKHLGGGQRHAQRREIGGRSAVGLGQRGIERRQSEEHGWDEIVSIASKIAAGFGWPGSSSVAAPTENGKVMELPKP